MNLYDELHPQSVTIRLDGKEILVERARLAQHFELGHVARQQGADKMLQYVALATGVPLDQTSSLTFDELLEAYKALLHMNTLHGQFPFMTGKRRVDRLDYPGRELATVVHQLASAYSWSRNAIMGLIPEEALFYLLEILVGEHERREFEYTLSQGGYNKQNKKQPFPALMYAWPPERTEPSRGQKTMPKDQAEEIGLIPAGVVIDLSQLGGKKK